MRKHDLVTAIVIGVALGGCGEVRNKSTPASSTSGTGGGNLVDGGSSNGGSATCAPSSPGALFANALCLCGDLADVGNLVVAGYGRGTSASAAVNGVSRMVNHLFVRDNFVAYSGLVDIGATEVDGNLLCSKDVDVAGNLVVGGDLAAGGNLTGIGHIQVDGTLRVAGSNQMLGWQNAPARGSFTPLGAPPCACAPGQLFDVAGAVTAAGASSATVKLSSGPTGTIGVATLTLGSGAYYSADAATIGYQKLHVTGAASLFVDGTLSEIGADRIVIDNGASLDLYVSGGVGTVGYAGLGDATSAASFRLYVGGTAPITVSVGAQWFAGSIYAPLANIAYVGDTHISGGLFTNQLVGTGELVIGGALPGSTSGSTCPAPPPSQVY